MTMISRMNFLTNFNGFVQVHSDRCRMFRFDTELKAWKERGIGEFKILKSKDAVKFRIVMRRDQVFLFLSFFSK